MIDDFTKLPNDIPRPEDDGTSDHLLEMMIPSVMLPSTKGNLLDISKVDSQYVILYFFPMMAVPGKNLPEGWNDIPGARGCTPQNITINQHSEDLKKYDAILIGVSTQTIQELSELSTLRNLSQALVSDDNLIMQEKLNIPTFSVQEKTMYKRLTLIIKESKIVKVFYPVFPPDKHVFEILEWLKKNEKKS